MKLLLASDIHSNIRNFKEIVERESFDVLLISGDLTNFRKSDVFSIDEILSKLGVECYAVHGNCDYEEILRYDLQSVRFIHGKSVKVDNVTIHGLGGSLPTPFETPSEYPEQYFSKLLDNFKISEFNVLLSHSPARGILDRTKHGVNVGSEEIAKRIPSFEVAVTGHVHECYGVHKKETIVVNPGPVAWGLYAVLELKSLNVEMRRI
ncbi:MAG: metallophosphoesterase family protein [Archaeoglobaceae archaeon]